MLPVALAGHQRERRRSIQALDRMASRPEQLGEQESLAFLKRHEHSTRCRLLMPELRFDDKLCETPPLTFSIHPYSFLANPPSIPTEDEGRRRRR
jgi:hypothetical protein